MKYRSLFCLVLLFAAGISLLLGSPKTERLSPAQNYRYTVVLLPLDSRPACTKFVADLGKTANIKVILPPPDMLDHYRAPGDMERLRTWFLESSKQADAAIVSVDMLVHGGLLASRESNGDEGDLARALATVEKAHAENPRMPIYAFHILPRLWLSNTPENEALQKDVPRYSKLKDQVLTFGDPTDTEALRDLERKIPGDALFAYRQLYEENNRINLRLAAMAEQGVFKKLIIGQDDGQPFGMPNIAKRQLLHALAARNIAADRVMVTKGTDEIALNLLSDINSSFRGYHPKINVRYADADAPGTVMPFMPNSVATTVKEKIAMVRGTEVDSPDEADFILFVYIGTEKNKADRFQVNRRVQKLLEQNYKVALVDLSQHFSAGETIFPMLLSNGAPINRLIAYAGWNTTSNSVGTAVAQATIFTAGLKSAISDEELVSLYKNNLTFLTSRFLEDYFYLKQVIDDVNGQLREKRADVYDLAAFYPEANRRLERSMNQKAYVLKRSKAYRLPIPVTSPNGSYQIKVTGLSIEARYPWPRTFEIDLTTEVAISKILSNSPN